jgi:hypothetical protein
MMSIKLDQNAHINDQDLRKEHIFRLLKKLSEYKLDGEVSKEDHLDQMSNLLNELVKITNKSISFAEKVVILGHMRKYFENNFIKNETVTINLCRLLSKLLIDERNATTVTYESKELIKVYFFKELSRIQES